MGCIARTYFRGGRVRQANEVGVLEGTTLFILGTIVSLNAPTTFPQKVRFVKILSLFVSLSVARFHRETTLRTPRQLPETAISKKVLFVKICTRHWFSTRG